MDGNSAITAIFTPSSRSLQLEPINPSESVSRNITDIIVINSEYANTSGDINRLITNLKKKFHTRRPGNSIELTTRDRK